MSTLIVTLPQELATPASLLDYVLSPDGQQLGQSAGVPAALLPQSAAGDELVVLVPAHKLSWHQVTLPKGILGRGFLQPGNPARLRAALEGLLEERLLDEPAQLHFAIEPQPQAGEPVWVAVCDRAWLQGALTLLEQAGRPVSRIVPAFAPGSLPDTLYVMGEPEAAQLVFTDRGGVTVWPLAKASVALLSWPEGARIVAEPAVAALAEQLFNRSVTLQSVPQQRLQAAQSPWDLAQFELVNSSGARSWKRWTRHVGEFVKAPRWRAARFSLGALLLVNLLGLNAWAWQAQALLNAKRAAVRTLLTDTFPHVRVVVDAPVQMRRELQALQQANGAASGSDLETVLDAFGAVVPAGTALEAIDFVAGELRLKGLKLKPGEVAALAFKLKPRGYGASVEGDALLIKPVSAP